MKKIYMVAFVVYCGLGAQRFSLVNNLTYDDKKQAEAEARRYSRNNLNAVTAVVEADVPTVGFKSTVGQIATDEVVLPHPRVT